MIVGLTGKAGAGKDTVADFLVQKYGFVKVGLADPIKALLNARFGWEPEWWGDREWKEDAQVFHGERMNPREAFSPRSWAQWLGTEVGRTLEPEVWVRLAKERIDAIVGESPNTHIVIPDIRFDNEVSLTTVLLKIVRESSVAVLDHRSERGISRDLITYSLSNGGSKKRLYGYVEAVLGLPWADV